jgi:hypothetical protein
MEPGDLVRYYDDTNKIGMILRILPGVKLTETYSVSHGYQVIWNDGVIGKHGPGVLRRFQSKYGRNM